MALTTSTGAQRHRERLAAHVAAQPASVPSAPSRQVLRRMTRRELKKLHRAACADLIANRRNKDRR